jgi:hypothetical protein
MDIMGYIKWSRINGQKNVARVWRKDRLKMLKGTSYGKRALRKSDLKLNDNTKTNLGN